MDIVTLDDEVKSVIEMNQAFLVDGVFSQDRYTQLLRLNSYSPAGYEIAQSKALNREQIKRNLSGSAFMSSTQTEQLNDLAAQQREVSYIALNTENYVDQVSVSQSQISDYFNDNRSSFIEGRKVKVDFVELTLDSMEEPEGPTGDDLKNLYDEKLIVFGNLPYNISSKLIISWLKEINIKKNVLIDDITITIQRELADKLICKAGDSNYGRISLITNLLLSFDSLLSNILKYPK